MKNHNRLNLKVVPRFLITHFPPGRFFLVFVPVIQDLTCVVESVDALPSSQGRPGALLLQGGGRLLDQGGLVLVQQGESRV